MQHSSLYVLLSEMAPQELREAQVVNVYLRGLWANGIVSTARAPGVPACKQEHRRLWQQHFRVTAHQPPANQQCKSYDTLKACPHRSNANVPRMPGTLRGSSCQSAGACLHAPGDCRSTRRNSSHSHLIALPQAH